MSMKAYCLLTLVRLPINGLSEVMGIISDTVFRNIVRDRSIVTPETIQLAFSSLEKKHLLQKINYVKGSHLMITFLQSLEEA